jgi:hypothetical protein
LFLKKKNYEDGGDEAHISISDSVLINRPSTRKRKADPLIDSENIDQKNIFHHQKAARSTNHKGR